MAVSEYLWLEYMAVDDSDKCWEWPAALSQGYGLVAYMRPDGRWTTVTAHRWAYKFFIGDPGALTLDHLCRNRACVNPYHLEAVTAAENTRRGDHGRKSKTHCHRGHEFTPENTRLRVTQDGTWQVCRACRNIVQREYRAAKRNAANPTSALVEEPT